MRLWLTALGLAATLSAGAQEPVSPGNADRGMFIFSSYCASCHGDEGRGDGPVSAHMIKEFGVAPANLSSPSVQARTDPELLQAIREGGASVHRAIYMPAWGLTLSQQQLKDVVAYLRDLAQPTPVRIAPAPPAGVAASLEHGRELYSASCAACHGPSGSGNGPMIEGRRQQGQQIKNPPDLASVDYYWNMTDRVLSAFVGSGFTHSGFLRPTGRNLWWHTHLTPEENLALVFYLRSLPFSRK